MKFYQKPVITTKNSFNGLIPVFAPLFISPVAPVVALATGLAALAKKGNTIIDSTHTSALTARKDFSLA